MKQKLQTLLGSYAGALLVSDYDGTLAASDGTIPRQVREKIAAFIAGGGTFTVCTGRTVYGFHAYDPSIINGPVILANGGMLYDCARGTVIRCDGLEAACMPDLQRLCGQFPTASVEFYGKKWVTCLRPSEASRRHFAGQGIRWREIGDLCEVDFPCAKIMAFAEESVIGEMQRFLRAHCPTLGFLPNEGELLEIQQPGVNKGTALLRLAAYLGIDRDKIFAIGDGYNDTDMLTVAHASFAPSNGCALAKEAATYVVCSNDEGAVAEAIGMIGG